MTSPIKPLNANHHSDIKIKSGLNLDSVKRQQVLPLIVHEFAKAGAAMPIIFIKPSEKAEYQPAGLMGLKPDENLFYKEGKWVGDYIPAVITHAPFAMVPTPGEESRLQMLINEDSEQCSKTEGEALFADGKETEYLVKRKETLGNYFHSMQLTREFSKVLVEHELLVEQSLTLEIAGEKVRINGLFLIDEKKLNELSDEKHLELRKRGFLAPIYAHLGSLHQVNKLAQLRTA
ncbi:SapC family protein [Psychrobium sp. 1_MG-2023]|uniref:SapC family protein n=1 Tax=Psychrobium sp. 1_MG-2023 TaxID=3062624 RepID=UPI000C32222E|nr:SapC family protein [Psychrobium sp. 1_MG-2023]MDP2559533.1 SapC family protein [Psychrobium sp. 1_MG-2023]PKF59373.1 multidrug transporter [Alteromonadales bacterium alter-6D02]